MKMDIIGAGGHSRSVIALLKNNNFEPENIYDDSFQQGEKELIFGIPVSGKLSDVIPGKPVCLAIGDNEQRALFFKRFYGQIYKKTILHSTAWLEKETSSGEANLIFGNVFVNAAVKFGNNNILNTGCIIEHECEIGDHNHISVSAVLCGRVKIGTNCFIGAGAIIKDKISICDNVIIGAGAVVVKNISEPGVYVGNPAKKIK
jgi:UDP-N-acetylbacillosamine N-acetyltransferase